MTLIEELRGPVGGVVALAFGMGAASGYAFALKTTLAAARERIAELREEIASLHAQLKEAREQYLDELRRVRG